MLTCIKLLVFMHKECMGTSLLVLMNTLGLDLCIAI